MHNNAYKVARFIDLAIGIQRAALFELLRLKTLRLVYKGAADIVDLVYDVRIKTVVKGGVVNRHNKVHIVPQIKVVRTRFFIGVLFAAVLFWYLLVGKIGFACGEIAASAK